MTYTDLNNLGLKFPYDVDGTSVIYRQNSMSDFVVLTTDEKHAMLDADPATYFTSTYCSGEHNIVWLFPQPVNISAIATSIKIEGAFGGGNNYNSNIFIEGSTNTTNGVDGSWESPTFPNGDAPTDLNFTATDAWRQYVWKIEFASGPFTGLRVRVVNTGAINCRITLRYLHIYGTISTGYNDDRLVFLDDPSQALKDDIIDYGAVAYPTTYERSFYIKNLSATKVATSVKLYGQDDNDDPNPQLDLSLTSGVYTANTYGSDTDNDTVTKSSPSTTEAEATQVGSTAAEVTLVRPGFVKITGTCYARRESGSSGSTIYVMLVRADLGPSAPLQYAINYPTGRVVTNNVTYGFNFDYTEELSAGTYTYVYYWWTTQGSSVLGSLPYEFQGNSRWLTSEFVGARLDLGNMDPEEAILVYAKLTPGSGTAPVSLRVKAVPVNFT